MAQTNARKQRGTKSRAVRRDGGSVPKETPWQRQATRRKRLMVAGIGVLILAVIAVAVASPILFKKNGPSTHHGRQILAGRILLTLPAASAVVDSGGAAYVTDDVRNVVERFNPANGHVAATGKLPGRPVAMVSDGGDLWVADMTDNTVLEVDPTSLQVVRTVPVPAGPSGLAVFGADVWVASFTATKLTPIDVATGTAGEPIEVLAGAVRVAAGFGGLWVTGTVDLMTEVIPSTGSGPATQKVIKVGKGPIGVATGAKAVWVANAQSNTVSEVDPNSLGAVTLVAIGTDPLSITVADSRVFVGFGTSQSIRMISPSPESVVLSAGTTPRSLIPVGKDVWVAGSNPGRVLTVSAPGAKPVSKG